jgi:hypothetical protein
MKVSTEIDNNFGYEKITQLVDNIPLNNFHFKLVLCGHMFFSLSFVANAVVLSRVFRGHWSMC